jgi:hypothetical protein
MRCCATRSLPIGCTVQITALAPDTTVAANSGSVKSPTTSAPPGSAGAVPARRTIARTRTPRSTNAPQIRAPTNPFAPLTTMRGAVEDIDQLWHGARRSGPRLSSGEFAHRAPLSRRSGSSRSSQSTPASPDASVPKQQSGRPSHPLPTLPSTGHGGNIRSKGSPPRVRVASRREEVRSEHRIQDHDDRNDLRQHSEHFATCPAWPWDLQPG